MPTAASRSSSVAAWASHPSPATSIGKVSKDPSRSKIHFLPKTNQICRMRKGARLAFKQCVQHHPCERRCDLTDIGVISDDGGRIVYVVELVAFAYRAGGSVARNESGCRS